MFPFNLKAGQILRNAVLKIEQYLELRGYSRVIYWHGPLYGFVDYLITSNNKNFVSITRAAMHGHVPKS